MFTNTRQRTIEWGDCDPAGIVFNPRYFEWFDAATAALFARAVGMTKAAMVKRYGIVGIPLVDTRATFRVPCTYGDEIRIESAVAEFRRSSFDVCHRLLREDGTLAVEGFETRVWVGRDPDRPGGIKAQPIPEEVTARFAAPPSADA
jgi:4-hydroxybenzoyl-CoA thioesterase